MADTRNRTPPDARLTRPLRGPADGRRRARQTLCVAFSGGVDSTVLLHLLAGLRPRFGFELAAAHVHHGLSPNADTWLASCAGQCAALGVPFHPFQVAVPRDHPAGLEAAARELRHAALSRVACDWLVFGHHLDDQAETMLFRLLRGAGVRGAAAMRAVEEGAPGRLRPLLGVRRSEIVRFAEAASLEWVEDESNADPVSRATSCATAFCRWPRSLSARCGARARSRPFPRGGRAARRAGGARRGRRRRGHTRARAPARPVGRTRAQPAPLPGPRHGI